MTRAHRVAGLLLVVMLAPHGQTAPVLASAAPAEFRCSSSDSCSPPDCATSREFAEQLWCAATVPDAAIELRRIAVAIGRMRELGGVCVQLAARLTWLQQRGLIRLFDPVAYPNVGGAVPVERASAQWLLLSRDLVTTFYDAAHRSGNVDSRGVLRPETLQSVLAHEADHLGGAGHVDVDGYLTPNTRRCRDF